MRRFPPRFIVVLVAKGPRDETIQQGLGGLSKARQKSIAPEPQLKNVHWVVEVRIPYASLLAPYPREQPPTLAEEHTSGSFHDPSSSHDLARLHEPVYCHTAACRCFGCHRGNCGGSGMVIVVSTVTGQAAVPAPESHDLQHMDVSAAFGRCPAWRCAAVGWEECGVVEWSAPYPLGVLGYPAANRLSLEVQIPPRNSCKV